MTRHNLDVHLPWLLTSEVTPPVGVHAIPAVPATESRARAQSIPSEFDEDDFEERIEDQLPPSPSPKRRNLPTTHVATEFQRPPLPPKISPILPAREPARTFVEESMGKLASAKGSSRPGLVSQHQLATPASTTGSTASSSLMQGYSALLRTNGHGTPSKSVNRTQSHLSRLQTPQTPRQTPRPKLPIDINAIESIDLTGDDCGQDPSSRSSSTEWGFSESKLLWTEAHASRPEPLPKSTKKRKSDGISEGGSPRETKTESSPRKARREDRADSEDYMDIDDMVMSGQSPSRLSTNESRPEIVRPSVEQANTRNKFQEQYSITETISRVETRTRKSISRVPSASNNSSVVKKPPMTAPVKSMSPTKARPRPVVQVSASPRPESPWQSPSQAHQTPQKRHRSRQRIIKDSDDDEDDEEEIRYDEKRASCSPCKNEKHSPRVADSPNSPRWKSVPTLEASQQGKGVADLKSRVGSPLRPISCNVGAKQETTSPPPFPKDSPSCPSHSSTHKTDLETPSSTLSLDDKKVVSLFVRIPSAIASYSARIENSLEQNGRTCMDFQDEGEIVPKDLKDERESLLKARKSYRGLNTILKTHQSKSAEKKELLRKIPELFETGSDVSSLEERSLSLGIEIRELEKEIGQLLHISGAIKDGFGTGADVQNHLPVLPSRMEPPPDSLAPKSSAIGGAQIVFQTQFPQPTAGSSHRAPEQPSIQCSRVESDAVPNSFDPGHRPMSHKASPLRPGIESLQASDHAIASTYASFRQPDFYRDPPTTDYYNDMEDDLSGLIDDAEEIANMDGKEAMADAATEDYGGYVDDDDMVGFAQEFEQRQSVGESSSALPRMPSHAVLPRSSESSKRIQKGDDLNMYSHIDAKAELFKHAWSKDVKKALKDRFKLNGFRHHQLEAINATLAGKDAFVLMPTGGGKSLCYQLPAVVQSGQTKGVTVVISPLLSLMTDQVAHLNKLRISAATLNSEVSLEQRREIMTALAENYPEQFIQLLYITPEMINKSQSILNALSGLHRRQRLARIVIDEAHCVSQWGHDFRPDYVALGEIRNRFPGVPFMALTATATANVKVDVMNNLGMKNATTFSQSFNRPNLRYEVRSKVGKSKVKEFLGDVADLIRSKYLNQTGIIYTLSRKNCEQLAEKLVQDHGIKAHHYHAAMTPDDKKKIQQRWQDGRIKVVVATIAFGMGIDKADVRFVVHHTIPKSLEGYYQETGRAGRDGKPSGCYLYYGFQDTKVLKDFIYQSDGSMEQKERQRLMLTSMVRYCENQSDCRRVQVLAYFGENFLESKCGQTCDNCSSGFHFEPVDFTPQSRAAMSIIKAVQDHRVTLNHCIDVLRGSASVKKKNMDHESLQEFGFAKDVARGEVERIFYRLLMENAIEEHNVVNRGGFTSQYVHLGPNCRPFMSGQRKLYLQIKTATPKAAAKQRQTKDGRKPLTPAPAIYPSTALTSPITGAGNRRKLANRRAESVVDSRGYARDDFVASDDEYNHSYASPVAARSGRRGDMPSFGTFGEPITTDDRMERQNDVHRGFIESFVDDANKLQEKLRNLNGLKKAFFTEGNFREMAINWTTSLIEMEALPNINPDAVKKWGKKFIPLIQDFASNYEIAMSQAIDDRDMDQNHQNVITVEDDDIVDLCDSSHSIDGGEIDDAGHEGDHGEPGNESEYGLNESDDEACLGAESGSKYFPGSNAPSSKKQGQPSRSHGASSSKTSRKPFPKRGRPKAGFRGRKASSGRKSGGSSTSGIEAKKKTSAGAKKAPTLIGSGSLYAAFGNHGTISTGIGSGFAMMPG